MSARFLLLVCFAANALAGEIPLAERKSGYELMSRETQKIQDDDATNPGMFWVLDGEAQWRKKRMEARDE